MLETITTVFVPTFLKTMAITCGVGGGILVLAFIASLMILILYPITRRLN